MHKPLLVLPVPGLPEIRAGDDLARLILASAAKHRLRLHDGDILVVAQKAVSKAEGRVYDRAGVEATPFAREMAAYTGHTPEYMELVLRSSRRIVRMANGLVIAQTRHGFVMANSGVDSSNAGGEDRMVLLPEDPDASARGIRDAIEAVTGRTVAVIISDTFGRPWRRGQVNLAVGIAGMEPILDYRGREDNDGRTMKATRIAVADELCSAAELVSGKTRRLPVAIIRGYRFDPAPGTTEDLVRDEESDLFK